MKKVAINETKMILRELLLHNDFFDSKTLISISKALFYIDDIEQLKPRGKFVFTTKYETIDSANNKQNSSYKIFINAKEIRLTSHHYFSEAFGLSHDSHIETLWPEDYADEENLKDNFASWKKGLLEGIENHNCEENLLGLNV